MKISPAKTKQYVASIDKQKVIAVLVYGPDSGGVSNIAKEISEKISPNLDDPFMVANIDPTALGDSENTSIYDEMMAISFGGGKRLVTVKNVSGAEAEKAIVRAVESLPDDVHQSSFLLVTAGDITPSSHLRKFFEGSKSDLFISIPKYKEDARDLSATIFNLMQSKGLHIDPEASRYLAESCQGDQKIIQNEVEKLILYLGDDGGSKITYEDVLVTTGNTTESQMQDVCNAVFSGDRARIEITLRKAVESGLAPIAILRTLQRYLEKLHLAYFYVKDGNSIDMAIKYIKPPIFYKQVPVFRNHLGKMIKHGEGKIFERYSNLLQAERDLKKTGADINLITSRVLQKIAA